MTVRAAAASVLVLVLVASAGRALLAQAADDCELPALETYVHQPFPLEVTRPDKEWVFIDVEKAKRIAARNGASTAEYADLIARIYCAPLRVLVSIDARKPPKLPELAAIETELREEVARRPGAELVEAGRVGLPGGVEGVKVDFALAASLPPGQREAPGAVAASNVWIYSRVVFLRPKAGVRVSMLFECPKERYAKAKPGWLKILKKLKLA